MACILDGPFAGIDQGSYTLIEGNENISYTDLCNLYRQKYDGQYDKITPFCVACELNYISDVQHFIKLTKEENRTGIRPEHSTSMQVVSWLSSHVSNIFLPTLQELLDGRTGYGDADGAVGLHSRPFKTRPLLVALENGHKFIFRTLVDEGASIDIDDTRGANALHYAMRYDKPMTGGILKYIICLAMKRGVWDKMKNQINEYNQSTPMDVARIKDQWNTEGWVGTLNYYGCKANKYDADGKYVGRGFGELTASQLQSMKVYFASDNPPHSYQLGFFRQKRLWPKGLDKYRAVDLAGYRIADDNYVQCVGEDKCIHIFAASELWNWVMTETEEEYVILKNTCPLCRDVIKKIRWLNKPDSVKYENYISGEYDSNSNADPVRKINEWTNRRVEKDKLKLKF